jgi:hypothetical protein
VDIFAQRQHVWIARPTLKAIDQEQSLATVHHWTVWSSFLQEWRDFNDVALRLLSLDLGGRQIRKALAQQDLRN